MYQKRSLGIKVLKRIENKIGREILKRIALNIPYFALDGVLHGVPSIILILANLPDFFDVLYQLYIFCKSSKN